jgi:hypothetical protein
MIADNHGNRSAVGTSAEDAYPHTQRETPLSATPCVTFAESVHSLRTIGIAEQRNEGDPD